MQDLDEISIHLGFSNVIVRTPKAEVKLRSGEIPAIALQIECLLTNKHRLVIFYKKGYPKIEPIVFLLDTSVGDSSCIYNPQISAFDPPVTYRVDLTDAIINKMKVEHVNSNEESRYMLDVVRYAKVMLQTNINDDGDGYGFGSGNDGANDADLVNSGCNVDIDIDEDQKQIEFEQKQQPLTMYRCKMCRFQLFTSEIVERHANDGEDEERTKSIIFQADGPGGNGFSSSLSKGVKKCQSIFLANQPEWLKLQGSAGKILCPNKKCGSKLGNWSWIGSACSCGVWQCPNFQFALSKVDYNVDISNATIV